MMVDICYNSARRPFGQGAPLDALAPANTGDVRAFHRTFREYAPTPLHDLPHLAGEFGLGRILIKDESRRFGLNAFKVLGASYAIGRYLAEKLGRPLSSLDPDRLRDPVLREKLGDITFATTTDGNHGRGVAWTARQMGQKAVVYMPRGSASSRVENIRALGAECSVTDLNYDDAVRMRVFDDLLGDGDILLPGLAGSVDHDGGEAAVDGRLADFKVSAVVQVHRDRDIRRLDRSLHEVTQVHGVRVLSRARRNLKDDGGTALVCRFHDRLDHFHIVDVECADRIAACIRLFEHFSRSDQRHG